MLGKDTKINRPRFGVVAHYTLIDEVQVEDKKKAIQKIAYENNLLKANI